MTGVQPSPDQVIGGIDTHTDTLHVAAIDGLGRDLGDQEFDTTAKGYRAALQFLTSFGTVAMVGVEGTSSYGAGVTATLRAADIEVREVIRPQSSVRRMQGKSDPIDAYQAARAVLARRATTVPKSEQVEGLRALLNARRSAVKARTAAMNQIHAQLITAPNIVREKYRHLGAKPLIETLRVARPGCGNVEAHVVVSLKLLAQRHRFLSEQIKALDVDLREAVAAINLNLLSARAIGPVTAAQLLITAGGHPERLTSDASFAALCGTAPVPASSGKTTRFRLSRGGDRNANCALHTIATVRMAHDPRTREFVVEQRSKGRSTREILRILKRAIAREVYKLLLAPNTLADITDLRRLRCQKNLTLTAVVEALGTYPVHVSRIERGLTHDHDFTHRYRTWLQAA